MLRCLGPREPSRKRVSEALRAVLMAEPAVPLLPEDEKAVEEYFMGEDVRPLDRERSGAIRWMSERSIEPLIVRFGTRHLFIKESTAETSQHVNIEKGTNANANNNNNIHTNLALKPSASMPEVKRFLYALVQTGHIAELDTFMTTIMAQWGISRRSRAADIAGITMLQLAKLPDGSALRRWAGWITMIDGGCEFGDYTSEQNLLRPLLRHVQNLEEKGDAPSALVRGLDETLASLGPTACSQLATTLICIASFNKSFALIETLWQYKVEQNLPIQTTDLTAIMSSYNYTRKFKLESEVYAAHPEAHHDASQFDYLLLAHAKTMSWTALKQQFDALFGIGKLPNVRHYEIVMFSLAMLGNVESIETLYSQFLRRGMIPTYPILQSLLKCHFKSNDATSCFEQFQLFEKYSVEPTAASYTIMFSVYQKLNDISGALRLLKTMTEENKVRVQEEHFVILMTMCASVTNHLIAREIFNIMKDHYDIMPHPASVAALINVYTESKLYSEAIRIFNEYDAKRYIQDDGQRIRIYNSALLAEMKAGNNDECDTLINKVEELDIPKNAAYFKAILMYKTANLKDFESAEETLKELLDDDNGGVKASTSHFEVMINAYSHIDYHDRVYSLYQTMTDRNIPVNSKILYCLVKSTFKVQMSKQEDLTKSIEFLDRIMTNAAEKSLNTTSNKFHPSVVGWALRAVAKYYSPKKALEILNRYDELFYDKNIRSVNNKFTLMRSLTVLFGELGDWDQFDIMYTNITRQLERYQKQPSSTVPNTKLNSLFVGLFSYKIRQLEQTHQLGELPRLIKSLEEQGFILDNVTWNSAVKALSSNDKTIKDALQIVNSKLVHGYNLIHKGRLLARLRASPMSSSSSDSWYLEKKRKDPTSLIPKLYLQTETNELLCRRLDDYLSKQPDAESALKELIQFYGYFMKGYLMYRRNGIMGWDNIEREHASFFDKLRSTKRVVSVKDF